MHHWHAPHLLTITQARANSQRRDSRESMCSCACVGRPRCAFYMERKRRCCKQYRRADSDYCGVHSTAAPQGAAAGTAAAIAVARAEAPPPGGRARVQCPVDPSHTVFADDVQRHVRVCSKRLQQAESASQPYHCRGCNSGSPRAQKEAAAGGGHAPTPAAANAGGQAQTPPTLPTLADVRVFGAAIARLHAAHVDPIPTETIRPVPRCRCKLLSCCSPPTSHVGRCVCSAFDKCCQSGGVRADARPGGGGGGGPRHAPALDPAGFNHRAHATPPAAAAGQPAQLASPVQTLCGVPFISRSPTA